MKKTINSKDKHSDIVSLIRITKSFILFLIIGTGSAFATDIQKPHELLINQTNEIKNTQQTQLDITGTVKDDAGEPLIGVSITVKGTAAGTATGNDGKYSISADANATLVINYLGYVTQEIKVNNKTTIDVIMKEDTQMLDEVVVVGYARVSKANLTGAVDQIRGDVLENRPVVTMTQALQGTIANLNIASSSGGSPGANQSINIRGYTGLGTSASPLIVLDGVQQNGMVLRDINPDDVESISVLKDAASAAIYGSSAPYGVIIITTKKGKKGAAPKITYNNNFGFAQVINQPTMMNSLEFANFYNEASANAGLSNIFNDETIQRIKDYQSGKITTQTIANPTPGADGWYSWDRGNGNNDWFDIYFKDYSFEQKHNIGVSGGSESNTYYIGLGYLDKNGMYNYGNDKYQRFNVRTNLSSTLTKWLSFNFRGNYSRAIDNTPNTYSNRTGGNYMHQIARKWATVPLVNPDGNYSETSDVLLHLNGGRVKYVTDRAQLTGEMIATPLKGWDITLNYTFEGLFENYQSHVATVYSTLPSGKTSPISGSTPNSFSRYNYRNEHQTINAFTSYETNIGDHYLKGMAGYTQEVFDYVYFSGNNSYLYTDDIPSLALTYGTTPSTTDALSQLAVRGVFGRINYGYKEKYLLELNCRYDGTSKYMEDVRYKFYPGVSAAWVTSKESFWKPIEDYVNTFKLRASYGALGDQGGTGTDINRYPFYPSLATVRPTSTNWIYSGGREAYVSYPGIVNYDLTWITTTSYGLGVDMEFLKNRLTASFDVYMRRASDFAVSPTEGLPAVLGATAPQINSGEIETKGFELTLGWRDRIGEFGYGVRAVLSDYQGECVYYDNPTGVYNQWYSGRKMGEIWGYTTVGLIQNQEQADLANKQQKQINANTWGLGDVLYKNLNDDDVINTGKGTIYDPGDISVIGNSTPRYQYGLTLDANYKGIDFSIFFQGVGKRDLWFDSNYFWGINGDMWQSSPFTVHKDRWSPENPGGYFPKYYMNSQNNKNTRAQTRYLQDASYLRIKNLQMGYTLPKKWMEKINFDKVRIYASVENLATFTNLVKVLDPEFGNDPKIYPLQRTWSGGISITF